MTDFSNFQNEKKFLILKFYEDACGILGGVISKMVLYGSYARGDYQENSDYDIMVFTKLTNKEELRQSERILFDLAFDYFMEYDMEISIILMNENHFDEWMEDLPFYKNVAKEGVLING